MVMAFGQNFHLITLLTLTLVIIDLVAKKVSQVWHRSGARALHKKQAQISALREFKRQFTMLCYTMHLRYVIVKLRFSL